MLLPFTNLICSPIDCKRTVPAALPGMLLAATACLTVCYLLLQAMWKGEAHTLACVPVLTMLVPGWSLSPALGEQVAQLAAVSRHAMLRLPACLACDCLRTFWRACALLLAPTHAMPALRRLECSPGLAVHGTGAGAGSRWLETAN